MNSTQASGAVRMLKKEYARIMESPIENITISPNVISFLDWHFLLNGFRNTPYEGGLFMGRIKFPSSFPLKPPQISMISPTGRFEPSTFICMTMTGYHEDKWSPAWAVEKFILGFISFMTSLEKGLGCIKTTDIQKRLFASNSKSWLHKCKLFQSVFKVENKLIDTLVGIEPLGDENLLLYLLNESLQTHASQTCLCKRVEYYVTNRTQIMLTLSDYPVEFKQNLLANFFSPSFPDEEVYKMELGYNNKYENDSDYSEYATESEYSFEVKDSDSYQL